MTLHRHKQSGYIAVTSAIIVALLVMTVALIASFTSFFGRFDVLDSQYKLSSHSLAEACIETALLKLSQTPTYGGNETVIVSSPDTCTILPIVTQGSQKVITADADLQKAKTRIKAVVNVSPLRIVSWEEIPL